MLLFQTHKKKFFENKKFVVIWIKMLKIIFFSKIIATFYTQSYVWVVPILYEGVSSIFRNSRNIYQK
jgi:hypothetical protein